MTTPAAGAAQRSAYIRLLRAFSFPASVIPLLLGAALAFADPGRERWALFPLVLVGGVALHAVANVTNDLFDHERGVDADYALNGSSGVLVEGVLTGTQVRRYLLLLVGVAVACGVVLLFVRGLPLLLLGIVGLLGAYGYTGGPKGYKYVALGDLLVGVLMGPLMVGGSYLVLTGHLPGRVLLASLPVALLVSAILVANNLRDVEHDAHARVTTVTTLLARQPALAKGEYDALVLAAYLSVPLLVVAGALPGPALIALLTLPLAVPLLRLLHTATLGRPEELGLGFVVGTAKLHALTGILLGVGVVLSRLL